MKIIRDTLGLTLLELLLVLSMGLILLSVLTHYYLHLVSVYHHQKNRLHLIENMIVSMNLIRHDFKDTLDVQYQVKSTNRLHEDGTPMKALYRKISGKVSEEIAEDVENIRIQYGVLEKNDIIYSDHLKDTGYVKNVLITLTFKDKTHFLKIPIFVARKL